MKMSLLWIYKVQILLSVVTFCLQSQELPGMHSKSKHWCQQFPSPPPVPDEQTQGLMTEVSHNKPP